MAFPGNVSLGGNLQVIDPVLQNLIIGYVPQGLIIDQILLRVPVGTTFGRLIEDGSEWLRLESEVQFQGPANIPYIEMSMTATKTFEVAYHANSIWGDPTSWQQLGGQSQWEAMATLKIAKNLMVSREATLAASLTSASVMSGKTAAASANYILTASTPLVDFAKARAAVYDNSGMEPNTAIMDWKTFNVLRSNPSLIDVAFGFAFDGARKGVLLTEQQLAVAMQVEKVLVGRAKYNSAELGQTKVLTPVWGTGNVIFAYINPTLKPSMPEQSLGYTFVPANAQVGVEDFAYQIEEPKQQAFMGRWTVAGKMYDDNLTDLNCAYLITSAAS